MTKNTLEQNRKISFLIYKFYHFFFSEKFNKKIIYDFDKNKNRIDLLNDVIKKKNYKKYLEIGCDQNQLFEKIAIDFKIGVDPISGGTFRGTSDQFFLNNEEFFDCIFIDGLHEYNQVRKDIINSLKFLNDDGVIILHDCLPDSISKQYVPRCRYSWNGDVWKAIVEARTWKECDVCTCLIDQGVSVIKKRVNGDLLEIKPTKFESLSFEYFFYNHKKVMRLKNYKETIDFL